MILDMKHIQFILLAAIILFSSSCKGKSDKMEIDMTNMRKCKLAGSWYPADEATLREKVDQYISDADLDAPEGRGLGVLSPHAGYAYSGPVMGYSFAYLREQASKYDISTIIVLAFSHSGDGGGKVSVWAEGAWNTPLGDIAVDEELAEQIVAQSPMIEFDRQTHENEHSLEILLPFLQVAMENSDYKIVPISFSRQSMEEVNELVAALANVMHGRNDLFIVSSTDMSHYHTYSEATRMDRSAIEMITTGDLDGMVNGLAKREIELCGWGTVATLMKLAHNFGAKDVTLLEYANSGDTSGDTSRVVGYGSVAFSFKDDFDKFSSTAEGNETPGAEDYTLSREQELYLLKLARETLSEYVKTHRRLEPPKPDDKKLREKAAVFVTLEKSGHLRGCIGQMIAQGPLYLAVRDMAISAAANDPRFPAVKSGELDNIDIEISVLSPLKRVDSYKDVRIGIDGVYIVGNTGHRTQTGVFLPSVATDTGWNLDEFLGELCSQKAGLPREFYKSPDAEIYTFTVLKFSESEMMQ